MSLLFGPRARVKRTPALEECEPNPDLVRRGRNAFTLQMGKQPAARRNYLETLPSGGTVAVRQIPNKGEGIVSQKLIPPNTSLGAYTGVSMSLADHDRDLAAQPAWKKRKIESYTAVCAQGTRVIRADRLRGTSWLRKVNSPAGGAGNVTMHDGVYNGTAVVRFVTGRKWIQPGMFSNCFCLYFDNCLVYWLRVDSMQYFISQGDELLVPYGPGFRLPGRTPPPDIKTGDYLAGKYSLRGVRKFGGYSAWYVLLRTILFICFLFTSFFLATLVLIMQIASLVHLCSLCTHHLFPLSGSSFQANH